MQSNYTTNSLLRNKSIQYNISQSDFTNKNSNIEFPLKFIDFENRTFTIGQWIDVKDTVDQWLEAEVINLRHREVDGEDKLEIKVKYIGWEDYWNEWLPSNSARIMPFRYYTLDNFKRYQCPSIRDINSSVDKNNEFFNQLISSNIDSLNVNNVRNNINSINSRVINTNNINNISNTITNNNINSSNKSTIKSHKSIFEEEYYSKVLNTSNSGVNSSNINVKSDNENSYNITNLLSSYGKYSIFNINHIV